MNLAGRHADASGDAVVAERALLLAFEMEPEMAWHGLTLAKFLAEQGRQRGRAARDARGARAHA